MKFPPDNHLAATSLACVRGDRLLFEALELSLRAGRVCVVEGVNGAGKTSLLRILSGLGAPEHGAVTWNGVDIREQREEYNRSLSHVGHSNGVKGELTALENLEAVVAVQATRRDAAPAEALSRVGLSGYEDAPLKHLSAGQRRRVAIARLAVSAAPLWILDEPVAALDSDGVERFEGLLAEHVAANGIAVLASHQGLAPPGAVSVRL